VDGKKEGKEECRGYIGIGAVLAALPGKRTRPLFALNEAASYCRGKRRMVRLLYIGVNLKVETALA
jgi:hypothetical protein